MIDVSALLPEVNVPTLVLHCCGEAAVPFDEGRLLAAMIPDARFVALEGQNHLILEDEPAWPRFLAEVGRFLGSSGGQSNSNYTTLELGEQRNTSKRYLLAPSRVRA